MFCLREISRRNRVLRPTSHVAAFSFVRAWCGGDGSVRCCAGGATTCWAVAWRQIIFKNIEQRCGQQMCSIHDELDSCSDNNFVVRNTNRQPPAVCARLLQWWSMNSLEVLGVVLDRCYEIGRRVMSIEDLFQWHQILNYNGNGWKPRHMKGLTDFSPMKTPFNSYEAMKQNGPESFVAPMCTKNGRHAKWEARFAAQAFPPRLHLWKSLKETLPGRCRNSLVHVWNHMISCRSWENAGIKKWTFW